MTVLTFACRCGHRFATDQWIGWGTEADATCPRCRRETSVELPKVRRFDPTTGRFTNA